MIFCFVFCFLLHLTTVTLLLATGYNSFCKAHLVELFCRKEIIKKNYYTKSKVMEDKVVTKFANQF